MASNENIESVENEDRQYLGVDRQYLGVDRQEEISVLEKILRNTTQESNNDIQEDQPENIESNSSQTNGTHLIQRREVKNIEIYVQTKFWMNKKRITTIIQYLEG
jgi:hypothetical protein